MGKQVFECLLLFLIISWRKKVSSGFTVLCISKTRVCECTFTNEAKLCLIPTSKYQREGVHSNLEKFLKKVLQRLTEEQSSPSAELSRWSLSKYQHSAFCFMYSSFGNVWHHRNVGCIPLLLMAYMAIQFGSLTKSLEFLNSAGQPFHHLTFVSSILIEISKSLWYPFLPP